MKSDSSIFKSLFFLCLFLCCFSLLSQSVHASEKVRIGYYEDGDYMSRNDDGNYVGFNFEYLQQIAKYTGWDYEIVDANSFTSAYDMLISGEIDMLPALYYTKERAEDLLFPDSAMCNIYSTLNLRCDDTRYDYEDFSSFNGMKVGVIRDSVDAANFKAYCKSNNIKVDTIPYDETQALLKALDDRTLDAIAITHLGKSSTYRSIAQFSPEPIYMAVSKNRPDLLGELNSTLNRIKLRDPYYDIKLYQKYFSVSTTQEPVFTPSEKEFIQDTAPINVVYSSNQSPLSYLDTAAGKFSGVVADLFTMISNTTGLRFTYIPEENYKDALDAVKDGSAEIIASVANDYLWAAQNQLSTTSYFLRAPVAMISANRKTSSPVLALSDGFFLSESISADNQDKEILYYDSAEECFQALARGDADITYSNTYIAEHLLSDPRYEPFSIVTMTNYSDEISLGISSSSDPRLFSILDKVLQYTSNDMINELVLKNSLNSHSVNWRDLLYQYPVQTMSIIFLVFILVISVFSYILITKSRNHRQIEKIMYLDDLTNIWNLNKFRLEAEKILSIPGNRTYAFIYADINQFKTINDTFGFAEGDQLLRNFANILRENIREGECCARVSADQFVLMLRYENWTQMTERTKSIDHQMNDLLIAENKTYRLIIIFGVYLLQDTDPLDVSLMLDLANYARRSAKITHKSLTIKYDENMRQEELQERKLANVMHAALENNEFIPYFQPKYNMADHSIIGSEALVRWIDTQKEIQYPGSFIPFFEKNGFIVEIDLCIYTNVCRIIRSWIDQGLEVKPVSCNFSRLHFRNEDFPQTLCRIADQFQVPHEYLELEITESVVMENKERVLDYLGRLKKLNFLISIDDFGSEYSSLGMLQYLTVDVIKLDRSFLQEGIAKKRMRTIIQGIINVIHGLNISIICEGVENEEQAEMLMEMGCHRAQGFYYARPMPLEEFEHLIKENH